MCKVENSVIVEVMVDIDSVARGIKEDILEEGSVYSYEDVELDGKWSDLYKTNLVCFQCGFDNDYNLVVMLDGVDIQDGLCKNCREAKKIVDETKFECSRCGDEHVGVPFYGGTESPATWSEWSGGCPAEFNEDGNVFCSENCMETYYGYDGYDG